MTKYIDTRDHAKIIRKVLKEAFPATKFSVRMKRYSGGSSIDVYWTDGPTGWDVDELLKPLAGGYFDGMTDYKGGIVHMHNGEQVSLGADFIFTHRDLSEHFKSVAAITWNNACSRKRCDFLNRRKQRWPEDEAECFAWNCREAHALPSPTAESFTYHRSF